MNLPWDQEAGRALRAAQAVLAPADIAWFEAAHAPAFLDPAAAMERIFGQLLGGDAEPAANADIEPEAADPLRRRAPHLGERAATEPTARPPLMTAPARRITRDPHARPPVSVRPHRPVAHDDPSVHVGDAGARVTAGTVAGQPPTKPGAVPDASPKAMVQPGATIPDERATPRRESSERVEERPGSNEIRRALVAADQASRGTARSTDRQVIAHGARAADPDLPGPRHATARSTRLVSGLSELNNLFRSVIDSQSDDRLAPEAAQSTAQDDSVAPRSTALDEFGDAPRSTAPDEFGDAPRSTGPDEFSDAPRSTAPDEFGDAPRSTALDEFGDAPRSAAPDEFGDAPRSADRHDVILPDTAARWTGPRTDDAHEAASGAPFVPGRQVALRAGTPAASAPSAIDTSFASFSGAASTLPDPAREDVLLDRLLDRFEERLREQAIRHLGFTGGLT